MVLDRTFRSLRLGVSERFKSFQSDESGSTAIEYGLIVSLIFLAIVASVRAFTNSASEMYGTIDAAMETE